MIENVRETRCLEPARQAEHLLWWWWINNLSFISIQYLTNKTINLVGNGFTKTPTIAIIIADECNGPNSFSVMNSPLSENMLVLNLLIMVPILCEAYLWFKYLNN